MVFIVVVFVRFLGGMFETRPILFFLCVCVCVFFYVCRGGSGSISLLYVGGNGGWFAQYFFVAKLGGGRGDGRGREGRRGGGWMRGREGLKADRGDKSDRS